MTKKGPRLRMCKNPGLILNEESLCFRGFFVGESQCHTIVKRVVHKPRFSGSCWTIWWPQMPLILVVTRVESLDLATLGFGKTITAGTGRPPYAPADLLKLYVAGYLDEVHSSRALERECHRNVECIWLLGRRAPDHKNDRRFPQNQFCGSGCRLSSVRAVCAPRAFDFGCYRGHRRQKIRAVASSKSI